MSRVYDALCQSEQERGLTPEVLKLGSLAPQPATLVPNQSFPWEQIATFSLPFNEDSRLVAMTEGSNLGAEKFRLLRARLRHLQDRQPIKRVVISSAVPEEGKTLVATNLGISLAKHTSQKVLLIEGDLHKPALAERMGLSLRQGLSEWLVDGQPLTQYLYHVDNINLWILPAGVPHEHPLGILQSAKFLDSLSALTELFDWILIDAPPLLPLADVSFWVRQADGLLLVVRRGKAGRKLLQKGLETLDNPRILGVVLNDTHAGERNYYDRYYAHRKSPPKDQPGH